MLYLIVPPIIVVLAIILLLWYLSRKALDPLVQERVQELENHKQKHFLGLREWGLRFLEKFAQRSKNRSLKMHNNWHNWLQTIRASRKKVAEEKHIIEEERYEEEREGVEAAIQLSESEVAAPSVEKRMSEVKETSGFSIPLIRRHKREDEQATVVPEVKRGEQPSEVVERPMVSAKAALPDSRRRARSGAPEEDLIGRIATNPKDFEAYEALGDFYMESGNIKDAKECYRQVLKLSPVQRMVKIKIRRLEKLLSQKGN